MESKRFNPEYAPRADEGHSEIGRAASNAAESRAERGAQAESGFETNRRVGERSRLAPLARSRIGRLALATLMFTTLGAEVACSQGGDDKIRGGEKRTEERVEGERAFQELLRQLRSIPPDQKGESAAQNKKLRSGIARAMIRQFLHSQGDTQKAYETLMRMIEQEKELAWIEDAGKVVFDSSREAEKPSSDAPAQRAANLLKHFYGMSAQPGVYQKKIEDYFNAFSPDKKQEALDALKAAMGNPDLVNKVPSAARTELQRALHKRATQ